MGSFYDYNINWKNKVEEKVKIEQMIQEEEEEKNGSGSLSLRAWFMCSNDRITPWIEGSETVFLVGDINARLGDRTIDILVDTGLSFAPVKGATYHFKRGIDLFGAIDHMASAGDATLVGDPVVLRQKFSGEWPTDHYPVIADYRLGASR